MVLSSIFLPCHGQVTWDSWWSSIPCEFIYVQLLWSHLRLFPGNTHSWCAPYDSWLKAKGQARQGKNGEKISSAAIGLAVCVETGLVHFLLIGWIDSSLVLWPTLWSFNILAVLQLLQLHSGDQGGPWTLSGGNRYQWSWDPIQLHSYG